ncbi:MAG: glycosyltransferase family 2 protein [Armatimonadetes bacterium]|nr:glycosyltransferase family 2 protein [Armatimonadota bacterium]
MTPRVEFLIPAYNPGEFLEPCLESLIAQTESDWRAVVLDDGSIEWPSCPSLDDPRVTVIRTENRGVSAARNRAFAESSADLVCFLDADDLLAPTFSQSLLAPLDDPRLAGSYCDGQLLWMFDSPEGHQTAMVYGPTDDLFDTLATRPMNLGAMVIRRQVVERALPFSIEMSSASEDWDFLLRAAWQTRWHYVAEPLYTYRLTSGSWSRNYEKLYAKSAEMVDLYAKATDGPRFSPDQSARAKHHLRNWAAREMRNQAKSNGSWGKAMRTVAKHPELAFWFALRLVRR